MAFIYCITNSINNKKYIGKTVKTIEERFKQHCSEYTKKRCNKRPLYTAMEKYGIQNFSISCLETVTNVNELSDREIYWIKKLNTYGHNGYNATKGGDGSIIYDYDNIINLYNQDLNTREIASIVKCNINTVENILNMYGLPLRRRSNVVKQYDINMNFIQKFNSIPDAVKWLYDNQITRNKAASNKISECCKKMRNKAYGYIWEYSL